MYIGISMRLICLYLPACLPFKVCSIYTTNIKLYKLTYTEIYFVYMHVYWVLKQSVQSAETIWKYTFLMGPLLCELLKLLKITLIDVVVGCHPHPPQYSVLSSPPALPVFVFAPESWHWTQSALRKMSPAVWPRPSTGCKTKSLRYIQTVSLSVYMYMCLSLSVCVCSCVCVCVRLCGI